MTEESTLNGIYFLETINLLFIISNYHKHNFNFISLEFENSQYYNIIIIYIQYCLPSYIHLQ